MQMLSLQVLSGANVYSHKPVVKVKLDLGELADVPSNLMPGFNERLLVLLPELAMHFCSRGYPGGFGERLQEGTYLAHIFEHVALEIQCQAGYEINFGKARSTQIAGIYDVILGYKVAAATVEAARAAERLLNAVIKCTHFEVAEAVAAIKKAGEAAELGPSTAAIHEAAVKRGIPVRTVEGEDLLYLGYGHKMQKIWTTITGKTSALAADLASDKELTKKILAENGVKVPKGMVVCAAIEAVQAWESLNCPVAVKPAGGNQGKGVTLNVVTKDDVERAFEIASAYDDRVVVEEYISGRQYRICVVDGKIAAAAERIPAYIIGDGIHTVSQLVDIANQNPIRGEGHERPLTKINIDPIAVAVLARQNLTIQAVPQKDRTVYIKDSANLSTGGTAVDVTDVVHPETVLLAARAAALIGLDIAGVDLVAADISKPIGIGGGAVIEVNAAPGIRMHHYPSAGKPRDVAAKIIDYLFPLGDNGRIPVFAITGTNGKTTVSRMIAHIYRQAGYNPGLTTTEGVYIGSKRILTGDTTGPLSARTVLMDHDVDVAVLETARGGILRNGLGFDFCDVGIVTNITEDHFGQDGIEDLQDLLYVKSLVIERVRQDGFALLNADDPCVMELVFRAKGKIVYFTTEADNIIVRRHLSVGGQAFFVKEGIIYAAHGNLAQPIAKINEIPVALGGIAQHNIQNAVIAIAACFCQGLPVAAITDGLTTFEHNPGRLNLLHFGDMRVCIDYGHNPAGYQALINTVKRMGARRLVGVIAAPGDRRDDVIIKVGRIAGSGFDKIYIKEDRDLRGRKPGETAKLLKQGVIEAGFTTDKVVTILTEEDAVKQALQEGLSGDLIVIFYEEYEQVMATIDNCRQLYDKGNELAEPRYYEQDYKIQENYR